ncbi:Uncharacterized protein RSN1 AltName: Full=Rescuer of SRO7 at high Nacl protein 1 [Serendipita indica DSM 11827]|nr:Uncharacterized protein RSN1 AltName: Full=Rescuer of SRO7 at high Nacl protein 1 [Serendipita indica DSM 11827]
MSNPEAVQKNNTLRSFLTSLGLNAGLLVLQTGFFVFLKSRLTRVYAPRSYLPPENLRAEPLAKGPFRWFLQTLTTPSKTIIQSNGLDAYMSIRFFEMMMKIFAVFTLVTWPILMPVNAVGFPPRGDGLARFTFGNIDDRHMSRYWAHCLIAFGLTIFVLWLMRRELLIYTHLRQQFLISRDHSRLAQAKTVLITSLPTEACDEHYLRQLFSFVPGGINRIWVYRNVPHLADAYEEREQLCLKLESATTSLLQTAIKARVQQEDKADRLKRKEDRKQRGPRRSFPIGVRAYADDEGLAGDMEKIGAEKLLDNIHRPMHRLGWIPFIGKKVDTIDYCLENIQRLNGEIKDARAKLGEAKPLGAAFIQCNLQIGAHVMAQCVAYHEPMTMDRMIEVAPDDVVWRNIDDGAYEQRSRYVLSWLATIALLIAWGFPVALAAFVSNTQDSCQKYSWLRWICRLPTIPQALIQAVFPPLLLIVLFVILPFLLKGLAWFENIPRWSLISLAVYRRYFIFLVVHGFLLITFFSILPDLLQELDRPSLILKNFSSYLPNASTFFLTYMLQQGLMGAAGALLQAGPLILYFIKKVFFGNTPREAFEATFIMPSFDFGTVLPRMSLLATIAFAYAVISPIINLLACLTFALFWVSWKFLLIWVMDQPAAQETSGLYFPLLIENLCNVPQGVLMILLIVITAGTQIFFNHAFDPVSEFIPMSLSTKKLVERFQKEKAGTSAALNVTSPDKDGAVGTSTAVEVQNGGDEIDLFSRERVRSVVRHKLKLRPSIRGHRHIPTKEETEREDAKRLEAEQSRREADQKAQNKAAELMNPEAGPSSPANGLASPAADPAMSRVSVDSKGKSSEKSAKGTSKLLGALAAAKPDAIKIDAAAKANRADDMDDDDDDLEENSFNHPSTYLPQRWIWLPRWERYPLSEELVKEYRSHLVDASDLGATIDDGGNCTVTRGPPDEDWAGGFDH